MANTIIKFKCVTVLKFSEIHFCQEIPFKDILTHINNNPKLHVKSYYYNRKYTIDELLPYIIEILEDGISFRKIKSSICWSTIYKFHQKLVQFKIIENSYELNVNKYLTNLETLPQNYYTDTTFVCNKLGEESVGFNQQIKKHKTTKISIITDDFNSTEEKLSLFNINKTYHQLCFIIYKIIILFNYNNFNYYNLISYRNYSHFFILNR